MGNKLLAMSHKSIIIINSEFLLLSLVLNLSKLIFLKINIIAINNKSIINCEKLKCKAKFFISMNEIVNKYFQ